MGATVDVGSFETPAEQRDIIVIGASAGGVEALVQLVRELPHELPAAIFVVLHVMASGTSVLPAILDRAGPLSATAAVDGERIERGHIYVAPPDRHLVLLDEHVRVTSGPRENGHRPAVDTLFRSAARAYAERVIGAVLSGSLDDGTRGLRYIKDHGGVTVAQDPNDAQYAGMPESAVRNVDPDFVVPIAEMPGLLCAVLDQPLAPRASATPHPETKPLAPLPTDEGLDRAVTDGPATGLTCPECGGALWERNEEAAVTFACRVGHAYAPSSLVDEQARALEAALWQALRTLEERVDLLRRVASRADPDARVSRRFQERVRSAERHAQDLRNAIQQLGSVTESGAAEPDMA